MPVSCLTFLSYYCDKITHQEQCREERAHYRPQFQEIVHHYREVTVAGAQDNWPGCIHQEGEQRVLGKRMLVLSLLSLLSYSLVTSA